MNHPVHFEQAPPRSWDQFEELCADTFQEEWRDSMLVRHGRAGQSQHGVDIFGRDGALWPVGIQCKKKSVWPVGVVTTKDLDAEVTKARKFKPPLQAFYLVSTALDDQPLIERARLISARHLKQGLFPVAVIGWLELVRRATRHPLVAAKHFGAYSAGPASPLLATWAAEGGKLLLSDAELAVAFRELIHDLRDYPAGRIVFRQRETEALLFEITQLSATGAQSLDERKAVLRLRDKLQGLIDREKSVATGLMLLFSHKYLSEYLEVWEAEAPLLVRAFVEQLIDPNFWSVTGLEKIRLHPPGHGDEMPIVLFLRGSDLRAISDHRQRLREKHSDLASDNVSELPRPIKFGHAMPAVLRRIVSNLEKGMPVERMAERNWFDMSAWRITF